MAEKTRRVEVAPVPGGGFELIENCTATQQLVFNKDDDEVGGEKMKKSDDYRITFWLDSRGEYSFVQDKKRVMLVEGASCPYPEGDPEFEVKQPREHEFDVVNKDRIEKSYKFTINMVDRNGNEVEYDPIYDNKNGGT